VRSGRLSAGALLVRALRSALSCVRVSSLWSSSAQQIFLLRNFFLLRFLRSFLGPDFQPPVEFCWFIPRQGVHRSSSRFPCQSLTFAACPSFCRQWASVVVARRFRADFPAGVCRARIFDLVFIAVHVLFARVAACVFSTDLIF
jgi:hypothetical protein